MSAAALRLRMRRHALGRALLRGLAMALLAASILPVLLLGPGIVRAPQELFRSATTALGHLEHGGSRR